MRPQPIPKSIPMACKETMLFGTYARPNLRPLTISNAAAAAFRSGAKRPCRSRCVCPPTRRHAPCNTRMATMQKQKILGISKPGLIRGPKIRGCAMAVTWQRFEGGLIFLSGLLIYLQASDLMPWWTAALVFFAPDLSFAGYALGARIGSLVYNTVHIYAFGAALIALGLFFASPMLVALGALWLAHSGFDRLLGYGLKSSEGFSFTHLGRIGKGK